MIRIPAARRLALAGLALLLAGGCVGPPTPALLRSPEIPSSGGLHAEASVGAGVYTAGVVGLVPLPEVRVGLRHGLGPHVDAGVSLSLESGLELDTLVELHHGPVLSVSLDPRVALGSNALNAALAGSSSVETAFSATLPVSFGIRLGPDDLVVGPLVAASWYFGTDRLFYLWAGGGVGLDVPVGRVHLLPELDASCEVGGGSCGAYLLLSLH